MFKFPFKKKIDMSDLQKLNVSSKLALKLSCLQASDGDVNRAKELYDYIASDMQLPDVTPVPPSTFQQIKDGAQDIIGWIQEHQNDIVNVYNTIQAFRGKTVAAATSVAASEAANIPPLPNT